MKPQARKTTTPRDVVLTWQRADPEALKHFNPATKQCVMNCGQAAGDPRSVAECKFLCGDCWPAVPDRVVPYTRSQHRTGMVTFTVNHEDADEAERRLKG